MFELCDYFCLLFCLFNAFKSVLTVSCQFYPTQSTIAFVDCLDFCCFGNYTLVHDVCCFYTTDVPYDIIVNASLWWIALIVVGIVGTAVVTAITCACIKHQKKKKRLQPIPGNYTISTSPSQPMYHSGNQYPISEYAIAAHYMPTLPYAYAIGGDNGATTQFY